jgi:uncharacterized protein YdhG (YjbR/CyaY superfamily)
MRNYKADTVEDYISSAETYAQPHLRELRKIVKSTIPMAEEKISWGVPFYWHNGALAGFSVFKNHISFGLAFQLEKKDRDKLEAKGYGTGSKTIQIKFDQNIPVEDIKRILKYRENSNEAKKSQ